ncbi:MAG TPA: hypothetical protein VNS12_14860 [Pelagibacterium sp.]|uniref:hypothetical protein n=1 Tax=Pelagibacterium sp. TaxID=1967288 RepID=UPI002C0915CC|nr:hypothetical protein [Pelagibacterium sp.]HWJ89345.1 hypothetical protein [Pelagibacterium sp.]
MSNIASRANGARYNPSGITVAAKVIHDSEEISGIVVKIAIKEKGMFCLGIFDALPRMILNEAIFSRNSCAGPVIMIATIAMNVPIATYTAL